MLLAQASGATAAPLQKVQKAKAERFSWRHAPELTIYLTLLDAEGKPVLGRASKDFTINVAERPPQAPRLRWWLCFSIAGSALAIASLVLLKHLCRRCRPDARGA